MGSFGNKDWKPNRTGDPRTAPNYPGYGGGEMPHWKPSPHRSPGSIALRLAVIFVLLAVLCGAAMYGLSAFVQVRTEARTGAGAYGAVSASR